jgi:hypothetical protein
MQQIAGREGIVERSVAGQVIETQTRGQRAETQIRHLIANQSPGKRIGVDGLVGEPRPTSTLQREVQVTEVVADVVPDEHGTGAELDQCGKDRLDAGRRQHHGLGYAGEHGDLRWNE